MPPPVNQSGNDVIKNLRWRGALGKDSGSRCYSKYRSSELIYVWMKFTTHTCGTEILSPAQYACVVDYVANLVYKSSETKNMQIFPNLAIPTRFRKNGLTGNRTRTTCVTGRDTKPLYCQPFLSR